MSDHYAYARTIHEDNLIRIHIAIMPVLRVIEGWDGDPKMGVERYDVEFAEFVGRAAMAARRKLIEEEPKGTKDPDEDAFHRAQALMTSIAAAAILSQGGKLSSFEQAPSEPAWWTEATEAYSDVLALARLAWQLFPAPETLREYPANAEEVVHV